MNTNLLYLDNDILNIIGDYVKKDNHERLQKLEICQKYAKIYRKLDRKKESERRHNLNDKERKEDGIRFWNTAKHFDKLIELVNNKYNNNIREFRLDYFISKPCIIFLILIDGEYKRFRYF